MEEEGGGGGRRRRGAPKTQKRESDREDIMNGLLNINARMDVIVYTLFDNLSREGKKCVFFFQKRVKKKTDDGSF